MYNKVLKGLIGYDLLLMLGLTHDQKLNEFEKVVVFSWRWSTFWF